MHTLLHWLTLLLIAPIRFYRRFISPYTRGGGGGARGGGGGGGGGGCGADGGLRVG